MGHCRYIFARDCHSSTFEILVENTPCGTDDTVTCTKTVFVHINGSSIVLVRGGAVILNGNEAVLPYSFAGRKFCHVTLWSRRSNTRNKIFYSNKYG